MKKINYLSSRAILIFQARTKLNLTQKELGEQCGYRNNAAKIVSKWETDYRPVPKSKIILLGGILNIDPLKLL